MTEITSFSGDHRFLSNFWPSPVTYQGVEYPTVEHAYQAAKTLDLDERKAIAGVLTPSQAKRLGKTVHLREDWEQVKIGIMASLLRQKFSKASLCGSWLLATGDAVLVEGNRWGDTFWGACGGKGQNHLGKLLMQLREEIK